MIRKAQACRSALGANDLVFYEPNIAIARVVTALAEKILTWAEYLCRSCRLS